MMIPITRKEKYINEIVGGGNTAPETPQTREEIFFADILGEVVAPSPITRAEKYLAKIANKYSGELPEPVTRIEFFIARAAGMNVSIPTPVTREEMFWADYALIVEKELSGIPPLTYKAIEGTLENYRIYGNTVNGESVGDRTGNLWGINGTIAFSNDVSVKSKDGEVIIQSSGINDTISAKSPQYQNKFKLHLTTGTYTYSYRYNGMSVGIVMGVYTLEGEPLNSKFTLLNDTDIYIGFYIPPNTTCNQRWTLMLNTGSEPLPYEPYGYKVPIAVTNSGTTSNEMIYLPEPIKMVGDEAEYIDYAEQKMHRIGADDVDVTLPALPVAAGTNVLSVGTAVQPSKVYVKYKGERQ